MLLENVQGVSKHLEGKILFCKKKEFKIKKCLKNKN